MAFTITEVVISSALLVICYVSLYAAVGMGWSTIKNTREDLRATEIMLDRMEKIRLYTWAQVTNTATYMTTATLTNYFNPAGLTNGTAVGQKYYVTMALANAPGTVPSGYQGNMRLVSVYVRWTNHNGASIIAHSRTNQTLVSHFGLQNYVAND